MSGLRLWLTGLLISSACVQAEPTNFRVGVGLLQTDTSPAAGYFPDNHDQGYTLFAEMPQSDHTASRFLIYRLDDNGKQLSGYETQLMWGWGLAGPGLRLYTGPAWHYEKLKLQRPGANHQVFNGWGWQLGIGVQYQAITLDLAATVRDNQDYHHENKRAGLDDSRPDTYISNLLISYRF